jgi:cytochrome c peroxidase
LTTRSRWDAFLEGKQEALTAGEVEGLRLFTNVGCKVCHTGELIGGSMFERLGAVEPWPNQADRGRFEVTEHEGDEMMFKVPTLRNVAETGPYFHDGSARTLSDAVTMMGKHQLGLELSSEEVASIVAWLRALTGELPRAYIQRPDLPASTASTPKPVRGT